MITSFSILAKKRFFKKSLVMKANEFFTGKKHVNNTVIAPYDKNYVIYINKLAIDISIIYDDCFDETLKIIKMYIEENFKNQTIVINYDNPIFTTMTDCLRDVKVIDLAQKKITGGIACH